MFGLVKLAAKRNIVRFVFLLSASFAKYSQQLLFARFLCGKVIDLVKNITNMGCPKNEQLKNVHIKTHCYSSPF